MEPDYSRITRTIAFLLMSWPPVLLIEYQYFYSDTNFHLINWAGKEYTQFHAKWIGAKIGLTSPAIYGDRFVVLWD